MLLFNLDQLASNPLFFLKLLGLTSLALLVAITFHEFSHALIAYKLGDRTAKRLGRLSLNPLAHLDPMGTVMLFAVGFGWGKPVPVNPYDMRSSPRSGMALVALAGPLSNLVIAGLLAVPLKLGVLSLHFPSRYEGFVPSDPSLLVAEVITITIFYNILLAIFNLIPIAPLDGFKVALGVLPREISTRLGALESYGPAILLIVIAMGYFTSTNLLFDIIRPFANFVALLLVGRPML